MSIKSRHPTTLTLSATLACAYLATGCTAVGNAVSGDKVDYRATGSQSAKLEVPPDLSQLPGQVRYGQVGPSVVSASSLNRGSDPAATTGDNSVATKGTDTFKLERQGQTRWLSVSLPPEKVWDEVRGFWLDAGFELTVDQRELGLLETNWRDSKSKVGQDGARGLLGRVFDMMSDSGERDQYRTRIERTAQGCEIYVSHRGMSEEYEDARKERTTWRARPTDPGLEAEYLGKIMLRLGATQASATAVKADAAQPAAKAAPLSTVARLDATGTVISFDADFDTAWRRVGLALDRSGFTVENRDRKQGVYEVRLSDSDAQANKPGVFSRLFSSDTAKTDGLIRYRVQVLGLSKGNAQISVLDEKAQAVNNATAKRIAKQLLDELN